MASYRIRIYGDPVLKRAAEDVTDIDGALVDVCNDMLDAMYDAPGLGLAAPQVGIGKRFFVYDLSSVEDEPSDGPAVLINPKIVESRGEWEYQEGCLSVPELSWDIVRPKEIHITGYDIHGNEVSLEADELLSRLFQHEMDHLDGVLLLDHLDDDQVRDAKRVLRERALTGEDPGGLAAGGGLQLP